MYAVLLQWDYEGTAECWVYSSMDAAERKFESLVEKRAADGIVFVEFDDGEDAIAGHVIDSFDQGVTAKELARYEKEYADRPEELAKLKQKYNWNFRR